MPILELVSVTKSYDTPGGVPARVLNGVELTVDTGDSMAIVGPSGSGKSTLLNMLGALDRPSSGTVRFEGRDSAAMGEKELARLRSRSIGFVFQLHHLLPQCTVLENVLVPSLVAPGREQAEARARRLLERVGLLSRINHRPGQLSGGERQRVAVVRALVNNPRVVLADEPTGSLDRSGAEVLTELLIELHREEGTALVVVTHAASIAARLDRTYALADGVLLPEEV